MIRKILPRNIFKPICISIRNYQVTVLGGATDVGQTICLLLRTLPEITNLVVHDTQAQMSGVTLDLAHIPNNANVKGFVGEDTLDKALINSDIVIGAVGTMSNPNINDNPLSSNTVFMQSLAKGVARLQPMPFVGIITDPINSLVPMTAEIIKTHGEYNAKKLFGITNIDIIRAQTMFAAEHNLDPHPVFVPVIGGRSNKTCIPLLSQSQPLSNIIGNQEQEFTLRLRQADDDIRSAKRGIAPVLSTAYSAFLFTRNALAALQGKNTIVNALIENNDFGTEFFSGLIHINGNGVKEMQRYSNLTNHECELLESSIQQLRKDVSDGKRILEYA